jgi:hypothetical protein
MSHKTCAVLIKTAGFHGLSNDQAVNRRVAWNFLQRAPEGASCSGRCLSAERLISPHQQRKGRLVTVAFPLSCLILTASFSHGPIQVTAALVGRLVIATVRSRGSHAAS